MDIISSIFVCGFEWMVANPHVQALWMDAYGATMIPQSPRYSPRNNYPCAEGISLVSVHGDNIWLSFVACDYHFNRIHWR